MFIHQVKLSRNHWSFRLLHWTFPSLQRFNNFCPHFWMTMLALIIFPFKMILASLLAILNSILEPVSNMAETISGKIDKKLASKYKKILDSYNEEDYKEIALYYWLWWTLGEMINSSKEKNIKYKYCVWERWKKYSHGTYDKIDKYIKDYDNSLGLFREKLSKEYPVSAPKAYKEKPWWPTAVVWMQRLAWVLLIPFTYIMYYIMYWLFSAIGWILYWMWYGVSNVNFADLGIIILFMIVLLSLLYIFSKSVVFLIDHRVNLFSPIAKFFSFFWTMFLAFKESNCPEIVWTDDDKQ